jgi:hypothetical protein
MAERGTAANFTESGWPQSGQTDARRSPDVVYEQAEQWRVHFDAVIFLDRSMKVNRWEEVRVLPAMPLSDQTA